MNMVAADNLASIVLRGFKEGSTVNRGCQHCLATPSEISTIFTEDDLVTLIKFNVAYYYNYKVT